MQANFTGGRRGFETPFGRREAALEADRINGLLFKASLFLCIHLAAMIALGVIAAIYAYVVLL